jgi:hypothetical protein
MTVEYGLIAHAVGYVMGNMCGLSSSSRTPRGDKKGSLPWCGLGGILDLGSSILAKQQQRTIMMLIKIRLKAPNAAPILTYCILTPR